MPRIDVYIRTHIDHIIKVIEIAGQEEEHEVLASIDAEITRLHQWWTNRHQPLPATHAVLTLNKGETMPGQINVDTKNETVTLGFLDDKNNANAAAPAGVVVTFISDNPAVASVAASATSPLQADVTVVTEGTANLGATLANADGTPVLEADGVTAFPVPTPVTVTVSAGAAVGAALVLGV
jgi:hypothetical protein